MANNIVQLTDYNDNNIYPIAGAAAQGSITKAMLDEGVFVGAELSDPGNIAYVGTSDIQDNAVTAPKLGIPCPVISENLSEPSSVAYVATDNIQDNAVTSDKIDCATLSSQCTIKTGYTGTVNLFRIFNFCFLSFRIEGTIPTNDIASLITIPLSCATVTTYYVPTADFTNDASAIPGDLQLHGNVVDYRYRGAAKSRISGTFFWEIGK